MCVCVCEEGKALDITMTIDCIPHRMDRRRSRKRVGGGMMPASPCCCKRARGPCPLGSATGANERTSERANERTSEMSDMSEMSEMSEMRGGEGNRRMISGDRPGGAL